MTLTHQIQDLFGLQDVICKHLHTPTNDVIAVTASTGQFVLKLYNPQSRGLRDVQWELALIEHMLKNGAPVVTPIAGQHGYVEAILLDGQERAAALFEWAPGKKPEASNDTYASLGKAAAQIHAAADTFTSLLSREAYDAARLIDEQLERMKKLLIRADRWKQMVKLGDRLKQQITDPTLDYGICHMDLTLDNVHRDGDILTVFDFDSAGTCWRALEPHKVLRTSKDYFKAWLEGYRSVRPFSQADEHAVAAFSIIGDLRVKAWDLGVAKSSRGKPPLTVSDLPGVVDGWLGWEREN